MHCTASTEKHFLNNIFKNFVTNKPLKKNHRIVDSINQKIPLKRIEKYDKNQQAHTSLFFI